MKLTTQRIDRDTHQTLMELAKSEVRSIFSDGCNIEFGNADICVVHLSIMTADRQFVVLEPYWDETPEELIDFFCIKARMRDRPKGVRVKEILGGKKLSFFWDALHFSMRNPAKISKLILLEETESGENEQVRYDAGLLLEFESGKQISILPHGSGNVDLKISHTPSDVACAVAGLNHRISFPVS